VKRFTWRLQRVLDIAQEREEALRNEIALLNHRIFQVKQEILARREAVRRLLDDIARQPLAERLGEQTLIMACASVEHRILQGLHARQSELENQRAAKMQDFFQARRARQTLERIREEARQRYLKEQARLEQIQFDESAHVAFARARRPGAMAVPA
jgi:flagellar biosynthesis chaperone FliJ